MPSDLLLTELAAALERPRQLPAQVLRHLGSAYEVDRDGIGAFLDQALAPLEDYEIDLILSPAFTPSLVDQALFAPLLDGRALSAAAIDQLIAQLTERPTVASLVTDDGQAHRVPLRPVTIERYVRRLRLDGSIPESLQERIVSAAPAPDRGLALAVARRAIWSNPARRAILEQYLERAGAPGAWRADDLTTLLRLVETYEPAGLADLHERLPGWIEAVRRDAEAAANPKPFFNERVEDLHGGGRDQRRPGDAKSAARAAELAALTRIQDLLA